METTTNTRKEDPFALVLAQNVRVDSASARRRGGMVRLGIVTAPSALIDFDAVNDDVDLPSSGGVSAIVPGTLFTMEALFQTDDISSNRYVLGRQAAAQTAITILHNTSSEVVVTLRDVSANTATLTFTGIAAGTLCALQVIRNGATVTGYLNGTSQTGTLGAATAMATGLATVGSDNNASFYDGRVDFLRYFRIAKANRDDAYTRLVNPRSTNVLVDYVFEPDANSFALDRGPYGLHGLVNGSPTVTGAPLAVNPAPIRAIVANKDNSAQRKGYLVAGSKVVPVTF